MAHQVKPKNKKSAPKTSKVKPPTREPAPPSILKKIRGTTAERYIDTRTGEEISRRQRDKRAREMHIFTAPSHATVTRNKIYATDARRYQAKLAKSGIKKNLREIKADPHFISLMKGLFLHAKQKASYEKGYKISNKREHKIAEKKLRAIIIELGLDRHGADANTPIGSYAFNKHIARL